MDLDSGVNLTGEVITSYTSPLDPRKYTHLFKSEAKVDRSAVDIGKSFNKGVASEILILLGCSLCIIFVYFLRKHYKNIELLEAKQRAAEQSPPTQVVITGESYPPKFMKENPTIHINQTKSGKPSMLSAPRAPPPRTRRHSLFRSF